MVRQEGRVVRREELSVLVKSINTVVLGCLGYGRPALGRLHRFFRRPYLLAIAIHQN